MSYAVVAPHKRRLLPWLHALAVCAAEDVLTCLSAVAVPKLEWHGPHPIGALRGLEEVSRRFWRPLKYAFPDLHRRDDVLLGGASSPSSACEDGWIAATGHFVGTWRRDWLGLPATGRLAYLRFGEFHRVRAGRIVESRVLLDLPDLMRQAGCSPLPSSAGAEILAPSPATHDGVRLHPGDPSTAATSLRLTKNAMFGAVCHSVAPNLASIGVEASLAPHLMRYGPCGLGATRGSRAFQSQLQQPFLQAFPDRIVGSHLEHAADGAYAIHLGWPAFQATHLGAYLGVAATGAPVDIRLMEFLRCERGLVVESWFLLDLPHLLIQVGCDLMAEAREAALAA